MFLFQKNHGAISVFLILILVPCMLVSSIFVDISRVQFGRAAAESSAELALNTLKTYYDYDLSQYYGLMGSCQNISEYYGIVSEYYDQALHSRDVEESEIQLLYQRVLNDAVSRFQNEEISDILQIQNETQEAVVSAVKDANMHNATIMQKQVIEFMKYRAPILIVQELIELLNSEAEKGNVDSSEESAADKPMQEAQKEYYEAESELLKEANKSYWALRDYTKAADEAGLTSTTLHTYAERIRGYRSAYEEINGWMIRNLYNTEGLTVYTRPTVALDAYTYSKEDENISYIPEPEPVSSPSPSDTDATPAAEEYHVTAAKVKELTEGLEKAITEFQEKKDALTTAGSELMSRQPGTGSSQPYEIQWWIQMNAKINAAGPGNLSAGVTEAGKKMMEAYAKVYAMLECIPDEEDSWWEKAKNLKAEVGDADGLQARYLSGGSTIDEAYVNTVRSLEMISGSNIGEINCANLSVKVNGGNMSIPDALAGMSSGLTDMQETAARFLEYLNDIIDGNSEKDIPSLSRIRSLVTEYERKLDTWEAKARGARTKDGENTPMSLEHQETIGKIRNNVNQAEGAESEKIVKEITLSELNVLEERLKKIRFQFQAVYDAIASMKYGSTNVRDIADYNAFRSAVSEKVQASDIPLTNQDLETYGKGRFEALFQPASGEIVTLHNASDLTYSPVLHCVDDRDAVPKLYKEYYRVFKDKKPSDVENERNKLDSKKNESKEQEKKFLEASRYHGPGDRDITNGTDKAGDAFGAKNLLGSMVELVDDLINLDITSIRDKLYTTEYIMNMFSYATFDNENYYDLAVAAGRRQDLKLKSNKYLEVYKEYKGAADKKGSWLSEDPTDSYNKTLTNEMINDSNNYAYMAEVEYILFGANNETSVKEAYKVIYEIRYLLNLASAFLNFWGTGNPTGLAINGIASTVAMTTAFIIPAPLVKLILIPVLAVFETMKDIERLEAGFPVELYKSKDDWWISLEGKLSLDEFYNRLTEGKEKTGAVQGLRYSDYLTLFVFLGLNDSDTAPGMYQRMADVIEKNMQLRTGEKDYTLEKTQVYFQLNSTLRVRPLMLTLPYFSDYMEDPSMKDDWCTYKVDMIRGY